jgi:hypothetical protein
MFCSDRFVHAPVLNGKTEQPTKTLVENLRVSLSKRFWSAMLSNHNLLNGTGRR